MRREAQFCPMEPERGVRTGVRHGARTKEHKCKSISRAETYYHRVQTGKRKRASCAIAYCCSVPVQP